MLTQIISETIEVDASGDAKCKQCVTYTNLSENIYKFSGPFTTPFHKDCVEFEFYESSDTINVSIVTVSDEPYQKKLIHSISGSIPPNQESKYTLLYNWKNFRTDSGFKRISRRVDCLTTYNLKIIVEDDTFTNYFIAVKDEGKSQNQSEIDYQVTEDGNLYITRQHLSPNYNMNIIIYSKIRNIELPVIKDVEREYNGCLDDKYVVVTILHLLRDSIPFFYSLMSLGINKDDLFIVGIPYSSKNEVIEHLSNDNFNVFSIEKERYDEEFLKTVKGILTTATDLCIKSDKKLLSGCANLKYQIHAQ